MRMEFTNRQAVTKFWVTSAALRPFKEESNRFWTRSRYFDYSSIKRPEDPVKRAHCSAVILYVLFVILQIRENLNPSTTTSKHIELAPNFIFFFWAVHRGILYLNIKFLLPPHMGILWKTPICGEPQRGRIAIQPPFLFWKREKSRSTLSKGSGMLLHTAKHFTRSEYMRISCCRVGVISSSSNAKQGMYSKTATRHHEQRKKPCPRRRQHNEHAGNPGFSWQGKTRVRGSVEGHHFGQV